MAIETRRGVFAALEALPATGVCERQPALLVPGYTGSKEDFLSVLRSLAGAGRRVVAIDMRGQYETPGDPWADGDAYSVPSLGADVASVVEAVAAEDCGPAPAPASERRAHLLGHSFGGLVAREAALATPARVGSLTLMSSGPGAVTGPRAAVLAQVLAHLDGAGPDQLAAEVKRIWDTEMEPAAVADGTPADIVAFLRGRMLRSCPTGLRSMGQALLSCPDRTAALASLDRLDVLVVYGEDDDAWAPSAQEDMAARLDATRVCIPGAAHSPAVEAPETVASTLTGFWNAAECSRRRR